MFAYTNGMSGFVRSIYHMADRIARTPNDASSTTRARSRALIIWTLLAVPIGGALILFTQELSLNSPTSIGLLLGSCGMILAIRHLRRTRDLKAASMIFVFSALFGLGSASWFEANPSLVPLIFLAVTPVYFGLIVDWRQCLKYTICLSSFYFLLAFWLQHKGILESNAIMSVLACGLAALGGGLSTTAYSFTMIKATRKLKRQHDEIVTLAFKDSLTGIYNRRAFNDVMNQSEPVDGARLLAVVDLDSFKAVNDRHGHEVGDEVLTEFAKRMSAAIPPEAKAYRVGGDEFAIIVDASVVSVDALAQDLYKTADLHYQTSVGPMTVGVSIGLSIAGDTRDSLKQTYYEADTALFEAKRQSDAQWALYSEDLGARNRRKRRLSELLKRAVEEREIDLAFQPQYEIEDTAIIGYEALARWTTDEFGAIAPSEFIAIAEEAGLINDLDRMIFEKSLGLVSAWLVAGQKVSVNVSGQTLLSPCFSTFVEDCVEASALEFEQIQIEITETEIIEDREDAREICEVLRALGISIALDDFGTGYSSLSYLSSLPINTLKIDKSFVQASHLGSNLKIIKSIVGLAHSLSMEVLVEGVENERQLKTVKRLGCKYVQGFYYARPLSADQCMAQACHRPASTHVA